MSLTAVPCRFVVVGGGITGLAAAHHLLELAARQHTQVEVLLVEGSGRCGGLFGSEQVGDYLIETGADSFITNKPAAVRLCQRLGLAEALISTDDRYRRSLILQRGRPVETPAGFNLLAPSQWWPLMKTPLLSWMGKLRVASEVLIARSRSTADESLADFVRRRFGQEVLDKVVQPLVGGIYTSDPEKLSLKATLPRFIEMEQEYGSVIRGLRAQAAKAKQAEDASGARYGLFASLKYGMSQLLTTLQSRIGQQGVIRVLTRIVRLEAEVDAHDTAQSYKLLTETGEILQADAVLLALPAHRSAELLAPLHPELANEFQQIEHASSAIVVSGHSLSDIEHPLDAFGLVVPHKERRRILAVSFLSRKFPSRAPQGKVILRTFVGGAMQPAEFEQTDEQIECSVLLELKEMLGVKGTPDFLRIVRYPQSMPQYHVGHLDRVDRIDHLLGLMPRLTIAGNALHGVGIPDSIQSGEHAAERLWESRFPATEMVVPVA